MQARKVVLLVVGVLVGLIGLAAAPVGGFITWLYVAEREDGYVTSSTARFATEEYALVSEDVELQLDPSTGPGEWIPNLGEVSVRIRAVNPEGRPLFVGLAPADDVARYMDGIGHSVITEVRGTEYRATYRHEPGGAPAAPPGERDLWVADVSGPGSQELRWQVRDGDWAVVIMSADGTRGVIAEVSVGIKAGFLLPLGLALLIGGLLLLGLGTLMVVMGAMIRPRPHPGATPQPKPDELIGTGGTNDG